MSLLKFRFHNPRGRGVLCQGVADTFTNFLSTLVDGSDEHKKTVLMICLLIPITKTANIAAFAIVDFYLFRMGLLIWQEVSVQYLILRWPVRPMGHLFIFRIGLQEYTKNT